MQVFKLYWKHRSHTHESYNATYVTLGYALTLNSMLYVSSPTEFQYFKRFRKHIYYGICFNVSFFATYTNAIVNWVT